MVPMAHTCQPESGGAWCDAVVFDLDGLLVDSEPIWRAAQITVFRRHGVVLTDELCRTTKGRAIGEVAEHWHRRFPWRGAAPSMVAAEVVDEVVALVQAGAPLLPGAREAVAWCRAQGLQLAVASSSSRRVIEAALAPHGLWTAFDAVCSAEAVPAGKPDPAVFLAAARSLGLSPSRCLVLEDSELGATAALAAGMACAVVPEAAAGLGTVAAWDVTADAVLGSLHDLPRSWQAIGERYTARCRRADRAPR